MRRRGTIAWLLAPLLAPLLPAAAPIAADDPPVPDVIISELMAANTTTLYDEDGAASDWIELWNRSSFAADLTGWHLADSGATWAFPPVQVPANSRLVLFASDKAATYPLHTNFKLSAGGEYLGLTDALGGMIDEYTPAFPAQSSNVAYGYGSNDVHGYLATPTPGQPNAAAGGGVVAKPTLSRAGGWIEPPVQVTAATTTAGATLMYTTDGSTPTATHGTEYTGPIDITATTTLRLAAVKAGSFDSKVASATFLVMSDVLAQGPSPDGWPVGMVNDQVYAYGFDPAAVSEESAAIAASLQAAPALSITTDLANLTDAATGINSNPSQSGSAWERPVSVELLDGTSGFQWNGGLRLKGGISRLGTNPKHNLRLSFEPDHEGPLAYPLFGPGGPQVFSSVDLRTEQNHSWQFGEAGNTMLRDVWLRDSQEAMGDPSTRSRWVHLFLNGQYWGLYMLKDRLTADHAAQVWGGNPNGYDVLKHADNYAYDVNDGDDTEWQSVSSAVADGIVTDEEHALIAGLVDLSNLADFWLLNAVAGNLDAAPSFYLDDLLGNNWHAIGGEGQPFRFFVDDGEHTLGASDHDPAIDRTGPFPITTANPAWDGAYLHPGWLHDVLLSRPEYRAIVRVRAQVMLADDGPLGTAASTARWEARRDEVSPLVDAEAARWGNFTGEHFGRAQWAAEVAWVETEWFPVRVQHVRDQLEADGLWLAPAGAADEGYAPAVRVGPATTTG